MINRINSMQNKVKARDFDGHISSICANNNILNINYDGIQKIK